MVLCSQTPPLFDIWTNVKKGRSLATRNETSNNTVNAKINNFYLVVGVA